MFGRKKSRTGRRVALMSAGTALTAYFFDPRMGRTRRAQLQNRLGGLFRRGAREVARKSEHARGQLEGVRHAGADAREPSSDAALTDKVQSEVLSRWNYPKGQISVNSVDGVIELRGVCDTSEQIEALDRDVRGVTGVADVHNYLHLPNTPAPNKEEAIRAGR